MLMVLENDKVYDEVKLFKEFNETGSIEARNKIVEENLNLVGIIANKVYNQFGGVVCKDDLESYGVLGLIDSINKYDISKGYKFSTYASKRIRGEMIDNVRRLDWLSRQSRARVTKLNNEVNKFNNKFDREPTYDELSKIMGLSVEDIHKIYKDSYTSNFRSLENDIDFDVVYNSGNEHTIDPYDRYTEKEKKELLTKSIDKLKKNEKIVISLYYFDELTHSEIAEILGLSESRISQINTKAIQELKKDLGELYVLGGIV